MFYYFISKRASDDGKYDAPWIEAILYLGVVLSITLILSSITANYESTLDMGQAFKLVRFYGDVCCLFILIWNTTMRRRYSVQRKLDNQTMLWEQQNKQLTIFQCESYYETLISQKEELQYIQSIIEKYDGSLSIDTSTNIFMCTVIIPFNQKMKVIITSVELLHTISFIP